MKKLLTLFISAIVFLLLLTFGTAYYLLHVSLSPDYEGRSAEASFQYLKKEYPHIMPWVDSLRAAGGLRDTFIIAPDGTRLHSYYVRAQPATARTALLIHGYTDNGLRMLMIGYLYHHRLGCNLLLPDLRNAGLSGGDHFQMGWMDRQDMKQWIDLAPHLFGDSLRIIVHGISMGAATTMMLSGDTLPPSVKCFVEDCGYTTVWDEFNHELRQRYHLPAFPVLHTANWLCRLRYGWSFKQATALGQIAHCRRPMLFIHGNRDTYVPFAMMQPLFLAKPQPKEQWIVPNTEHAKSYQTHPETYTLRVSRFVDKWMEKPDSPQY